MMNEALPSTEFSNHPFCGHVPWRCEKLSKRGRNATVSSGVNALSIKDVQNSKCRSAKTQSLAEDRVEHRLEIDRRGRS